MKRIILSVILFIFLALVADRPIPAGEAVPAGAAWVVEWDLEAGLKERAALGPALASTQLFAATFDAADRPRLPDSLAAWIKTVRPDAGGKLFLTVVNDIVRDGADNSLKDPDLITRLLASPQSRDRHRRDLLELVRSGPFDGLDIDYERVKREDFPAFLAFCRDLAAELKAAGFGLRVVLEPKKYYFEQPLPPGPEYVVMAYNLFGGHSGPGPKADDAFIARLAAFCRNAGADVRLALSTGGFIWRQAGKTGQLTEAQAAALARDNSATPARDPSSRYLHFTFEDEESGRNDVWYADGATLAHLVATGRAHGFTAFDVWRLGGNAGELVGRVRDALAPPVGRDYFVDAAAPADGDGSSPERALANIGAAIGKAEPGDRVVVAPGVYTESIVVKRPGLTVMSPPGTETGTPVRVNGAGAGPALRDEADTLWRGVAFANPGGGEVANLFGFEGRFEHCRFEDFGTDPAGFALTIGGGSPEFHASVLSGRGGQALRAGATVFQAGSARALADFTYCLVEGFAGGVLIVSGDIDARFANCVLTRNGRLVSRATAYAGDVSLVNCALFMNLETSHLLNATAGPPVLLSHSLFSPPLNRNFWVQRPFPADLPEWDTVEARCLSPRFRDVGHPVWLNLGIDDTLNLGVWEKLAEDPASRGLRFTLAINAAVATEPDWERIRRVLATGPHEVGSHTMSHATVAAGVPMSVGYDRPGLEKATLEVDDGRTLRVRDGERVIFSRSLETSGLTLGALARSLELVGVKSRLSSYHAGIPASFLSPVREIDIAFPNPVVPLELDTGAFIEYELRDSRKALAEHLPELREYIFINPFARSSPMAKAAIRDAGYAAARVSFPDSNFTKGADNPEYADDPYVADIYGIPSVSLKEIRTKVREGDWSDNLWFLLDYVKMYMPFVSIYSHTETEFSLDEWRRLFPIILQDPKITVMTLGGMKRRIVAEGEALGDDLYRLPRPAMSADYRPRHDSPMLGAGAELGLARDFAGNPVPGGRAPDIGLYQAERVEE